MIRLANSAMIPTPTNPLSDLPAQQQSVAVQDQTTVVIPVIAEQLNIDKQLIETGQVRISKTVREDEQVIDLPLTRETVEVERVAIGQHVAEAPAVRREGDTVIYPVLEEVIVVEKRLMLIEEIRVTTRQTVVREPQTVSVRREEISVERTPATNTEERSAL